MIEVTAQLQAAMQQQAAQERAAHWRMEGMMGGYSHREWPWATAATPGPWQQQLQQQQQQQLQQQQLQQQQLQQQRAVVADEIARLLSNLHSPSKEPPPQPPPQPPPAVAKAKPTLRLRDALAALAALAPAAALAGTQEWKSSAIVLALQLAALLAGSRAERALVAGSARRPAAVRPPRHGARGERPAAERRR